MADKYLTTAVGAVTMVVASLAFSSTSFAGNCLNGPGMASPVMVSAFNASPEAFLFANGSAIGLSDQVRSYTATETDLTAKMIDLAKAGTPAQMAAIGAGLGRAANICRPQHPELADAITKAIADALLADTTLGGLQTAFVQALNGQTATAALGSPGSAAAAAADIANGPAGDILGGGEGDGSTDGSQNSTANLLRTSASGGGNFSTQNTQSVSPSGT